MGLEIYASWGASDGGAPPPTYPIPTLLVLECDGATHGFFKPPPATIPGDSFIEQHKAAMLMGWKETYDERGARIWLCPECSGKHKGKAATE